ncbi:unnamed protein product [Oppiella nova]|uniref:Uncharacterized protein n=1 Tax=Oppiella nova TaxID=334625 RepID=A0A7R9ML95_9ACAR|nr:unnamed protein product [Oppiella nova]CAG2179140.1 unnamed protein product [Oppiella nova]
MYKNTTLLYSIIMTNNNGTGCLSTSSARQMDSTIRLHQDHVVITIPHPTDTTMGNYSCQFNYLDITHNSQLIYSSLLNICNKKSCTRLHIRQGTISPYTGKQDYNHDNYTYYESCVYSTNGSAQVTLVTADSTNGSAKVTLVTAVFSACLLMLALT